MEILNVFGNVKNLEAQMKEAILQEDYFSAVSLLEKLKKKLIPKLKLLKGIVQHGTPTLDIKSLF